MLQQIAINFSDDKNLNHIELKYEKEELKIRVVDGIDFNETIFILNQFQIQSLKAFLSQLSLGIYDGKWRMDNLNTSSQAFVTPNPQLRPTYSPGPKEPGVGELWLEFNKIRDKIHKARKVIYGVPPDHWELVEKVAIKELVANENNKLKAEYEEKIKSLKEFKFKYESLCK